MEETLVERLVERDIIVYRFYKSSRLAVDQYLSIVDPDIEAHIATYGYDDPMFYVLDVSRSGMFSVNYMRERVNEVVKRHQKTPLSYIAYVTDNPADSVLVNMIDALTARQLEHTRKVFAAQQFDDAIDWLLSTRTQHKSRS